MNVTNHQVYVVAYNSLDFKICADIVYQCILEQEKGNNKEQYYLDRLRPAAIENYIRNIHVSGTPAPTREEFYQILLYVSQQLIDGKKNQFSNN